MFFSWKENCHIPLLPTLFPTNHHFPLPQFHNDVMKFLKINDTDFLIAFESPFKIHELIS